MDFKQAGYRVVLVCGATAFGLVAGTVGYRSLHALGYDFGFQSAEAAKANVLLNSVSANLLYITAHESPEFESLAKKNSVAIITDASLINAIDAQTPLDALILDYSSKDQIDRNWLQQRFDEGLLVVGVNVPIVELAALVGDDGAVLSWSGQEPPSAPLSMLRLVVTGDAEEVARWWAESPDLLLPDGSYETLLGVKGALAINHSASQISLDDSKSVELVFHNIAINLGETTH